MYITVLEDALDWDDDTKSDFAKILSLIPFGKSPLTHRDISDIIGLEMYQTLELLSCLRSLVVFEEDQQVKIHHATFYDYLVSCKGKPWYIDARIHEVVIASRCFETMATSLKHDICNLQSSPSLGKNV